MKLNDVLYVAISLCLLAGCSVIEDRTGCPCHLTLDFSRTDTQLIRSVDIILSEKAGGVQEISLDAEQFMPEYMVDVSRSEVLLNVYFSLDEIAGWSDGIYIPLGEDCPRLYMHSSRVMTYAEEVTDTVVLRKNHCVMDIVIEDAAKSKFVLKLKGNINGYDSDGLPAEGRFEYIPLSTGENTSQAVLPRQSDSSLILEIDDGTGIVKTFALGEYVASGGYDWTEPDLRDVTVYIDWRMTTLSVSVDGWDWEHEHEIII